MGGSTQFGPAGNMAPMPPTYPTLGLPAVLFAQGGAAAHAPDHSLEAFRLGLRLGATGLAASVWSTADGRPVVHADPAVGPRLRRRQIDSLTVAELPDTVLGLEELLEVCVEPTQVLLDLSHPALVDPVLSAAERSGVAQRLWVALGDLEALAERAGRWGPARAVHRTRAADLGAGQERHAARLREAQVAAVLLDQSDWTAGSVALYHRFGRACVGWGATHPRMVRSLLDMGIDAVASDTVDRMVDAAGSMG